MLTSSVPAPFPPQVDYEAIRQVRDLAFDDPPLLSVRGSNRWRQCLRFISRSGILFPARLYPFQATAKAQQPRNRKGASASADGKFAQHSESAQILSLSSILMKLEDV